MRVSRTALPLVLALCLPSAGAPVDPRTIAPDDIEPAGAPNAAYLEAARWQGLQTGIVYLKPGAPLPEGAVAVPEAPDVPDADAERRSWTIIAGAVLLAVLAFAAWYGRGITASFGSARDPVRRGAGPTAEAAPARDLPPDAFLASLAAMPDRRRALILLVARALERGAEANGLRLGRAQTARDVLRALPGRWPHLAALRQLVAEAEIVHFGGRDLPEGRWQTCLDRARPLFGAGQPG